MKGLTNLTLCMMFGFIMSITAMLRALSTAAGVGGRRSVLAGFASPALLLALEIMHGSPVSHTLNYVFAFAAGSLVSSAMFVPWIGRRATERVKRVALRDEADGDFGARLYHAL